MNQDLFGGLFKGLSAFLPQDDPQVKLMTLQNQLTEAKQSLVTKYADLGKVLLPLHVNDANVKQDIDMITLLTQQVTTYQSQLDHFIQQQNEKEQNKQRTSAASFCTVCNTENELSSKFCQQCGSKLSVLSICSVCAKENPVGTRFCSECGARLQ